MFEYDSPTSTEGLVVISLDVSACDGSEYIQWSIGIRMLLSLNVECNNHNPWKTWPIHECRQTEAKIFQMKLSLISSHFSMLALTFTAAAVRHLNIPNQFQNIGR
jgi:hypothetical protein